MTVLIFIVILAVLILSHELGHFSVAKRFGIRVDEFGLGFPPRLWGRRRGETVYSINLIPFGGFVKIFGENPEDENLEAKLPFGSLASKSDLARSLTAKPKLVQAAVLAAGVAANLVLAWLLIAVGLTVGLPTSVSELPADYDGVARVIIAGVVPESPAAAAGLRAGDAIVYLGETLPDGGFSPADIAPSEVEQFVAAHADAEFTLGYQRGKVLKEENLPTYWLTLKPVAGLIPDRAAIGIAMDQIGLLRLSPPRALWRAVGVTAGLTKATALGLGRFVWDAVRGRPVLSQVTGPVGLAGLVGAATNLGWIYLLSFTAIISINLAVINLAPFPALDGGRLLFLLIEKLKGSPIKPKVANALNLVGFALLLLLMLVITYRDIANLF